MRKQLRKWLGMSFLAACLWSGQSMMAQSVIFPQEKQAGLAGLVVEQGAYTLQNELLKAKFVVKDNHLFFGGSEELGLLGGSELFSVLLADGREVPASAMQMKQIREINLNPVEGAAKGALKLNGKAVEAEFAFENLSLLWKAVLRDGSHYLRTELEVTAQQDVAMRGLVAMKYTYDNQFGKQLPQVVGQR